MFSMRSLGWTMKEREANDIVAGGLLVLLSLLLLQALCSLLGNGANVDVTSGWEDPLGCKGEISAFNKMTLGLPVSINREGLEGLTAVPGIGPKIAESIVRARDKRGGFESLEEIKSVRGIGPALFRRIRPYIVL